MSRTLTSLGKRPVVVGDVPGFVWNRLQFAVLREAAWLVATGAAAPESIDTIVRFGLARRWSVVGPFETMALGGRNTFMNVARLLFPRLCVHQDVKDLELIVLPGGDYTETRKRRDRGLIAALRSPER